MSGIRRGFYWFFMILKSLMKKYSYILILLLIPLLIFSMKLVSKQESGVLTILLVQTDTQDEVSSEVIQKLIGQKSVIRFIRGEREAAKRLVEEQQVDAAWIFEDNLTDDLLKYTQKGKAKKGFIKIIELEDTLLLKLSREKLYAALYPRISYAGYENFIEMNFVETQMIAEDKEAWRAAYEQANREDNIFVFSFPDTSKEVVDFEQVNYLLAPLRGMLLMVIVLSSLASQMYFLRDYSKGTFVWLPKFSVLGVSYAYQFAAMLPVCIVVYAAIYLSGLYTGFGIEFGAILLFVFMMAPFGNILRRFCRDLRVLGALIPVVVIVMVSLSQIFFEVNVFRPALRLLPTYYYMNAIYNSSFVIKMLVYCLTAILLDGVTFLCIEKKKQE